MARVPIIVASLVVLMTLATEASIYRTIITTITTEIRNDHTSKQGRCGEQMKDVEFDKCVKYLVPPFEAGPDMVKECCKEIKKMDNESLCEVIEKLMPLLPEGQMGQQMKQMAQQLPITCGMGSSCQMARAS